MGELLHACALASAVAGACCTAADRPASRVRELVLAAAMVVAMLDVATGPGLVPPVWWAVVLVLAGVGSALGTDRRRTDAAARGMRAVDAIGVILTAGLLLVMAAGHGTAEGAAHSHGSPAPAALLAAASVVYAGACVVVACRMPHPAGAGRTGRVRRAGPVAMGLSTLLMAGAALV